MELFIGAMVCIVIVGLWSLASNSKKELNDLYESYIPKDELEREHKARVESTSETTKIEEKTEVKTEVKESVKEETKVEPKKTKAVTKEPKKKESKDFSLTAKLLSHPTSAKVVDFIEGLFSIKPKEHKYKSKKVTCAQNTFFKRELCVNFFHIGIGKRRDKHLDLYSLLRVYSDTACVSSDDKDSTATDDNISSLIRTGIEQLAVGIMPLSLYHPGAHKEGNLYAQPKVRYRDDKIVKDDLVYLWNYNYKRHTKMLLDFEKFFSFKKFKSEIANELKSEKFNKYIESLASEQEKVQRSTDFSLVNVQEGVKSLVKLLESKTTDTWEWKDISWRFESKSLDKAISVSNNINGDVYGYDLMTNKANVIRFHNKLKLPPRVLIFLEEEFYKVVMDIAYRFANPKDSNKVPSMTLVKHEFSYPNTVMVGRNPEFIKTVHKVVKPGEFTVETLKKQYVVSSVSREETHDVDLDFASQFKIDVYITDKDNEGAFVHPKYGMDIELESKGTLKEAIQNLKISGEERSKFTITMFFTPCEI